VGWCKEYVTAQKVNAPSFHLSFIHSFMSYSVSREVLSFFQSAIYWSSPFLQISCRCLRLLRVLSLTSNLPSFFHAISCSIRQFLNKIWPIKLHASVFIEFNYYFPPWLYVILLHFPHNWTNPASSSAPSTTVHSSSIHLLVSELCKFQHHKKHLLQMQQFNSFFQKIQSNLLLKRISYFWMQLLQW
jgi:hypothetical protein